MTKMVQVAQAMKASAQSKMTPIYIYMVCILWHYEVGPLIMEQNSELRGWPWDTPFAPRIQQAMVSSLQVSWKLYARIGATKHWNSRKGKSALMLHYQLSWKTTLSKSVPIPHHKALDPTLPEGPFETALDIHLSIEKEGLCEQFRRV